MKLDPATTCLGVLDLQNEVVDPKGYF